jgi:pimeloyl-ACP methyl ester carboxylesterase
LHVFNAAGHFPFREHPARFNELLAGFVTRQAGDA